MASVWNWKTMAIFWNLKTIHLFQFVHDHLLSM
jgi:hypothetical protein